MADGALYDPDTNAEPFARAIRAVLDLAGRPVADIQSVAPGGASSTLFYAQH
jgi:hypothetical protein